MEFVKCKNETEKLQAITEYCNAQIEKNNYNLNWYRSEQSSPLDYEYEINELNAMNARFKKIIEIIEADEFTSIMLF